jgi:23S rRNA (uracil1939-C5)-methyltransferase
VATAEANALLAGLAQAVAARPPAQEVEVEPAALGESAGVVVRPQGRPPARLQAWVKGLAQALAAPVYLGRPRLSVVPDSPPAGSLELPWGRLSLALFPSVFGQAQAAQNQALIAAVLDLASAPAGRPVLDLMAGMGNLSLPLALTGAEVMAVELDPLACLNGAFNARRWHLATPFLNLDAAEALGRFRPGQFQTVILDPPRRGIKELLPRLAGLAPERLVYVSCQPATLARDLKALAQAGYRVARLIPLDLFPQTFHLETVALAERG